MNKRSNMQVRVRKLSIPYRGKRIKAKDYPGTLPLAEPWPWQLEQQPKKEETP